MVSAPQHDAHVRELRKLQRDVERNRVHRARYRLEDNNYDGRPRVDKLSHVEDDPLLQTLKRGKR